MIVSDRDPQFVSQEFQLFVTSWGITNVTSSPMHQRANGKAESAVKILQFLLIKTHKEGGDPYEVMLEQRNFPRQDPVVVLQKLCSAGEQGAICLL